MQSTKRSAANRLLDLAVGAMDLFQHDQIAYAALVVDGHRETHLVRSRWIRLWLRRRHWQHMGEAARPATVNLCVDTLEAIATDPALPPRQVYRRVASVEDKLYLDLSNADWTCVEIDASGWRVVPDGPHFLRSRSTRALPTPVPTQTTARDGLLRFRGLVNIPADEFILVVAWLLTALKDAPNYPVLVILGEHGSAKTSATELIRSLVDPSVIETRGPSRTEKDLFVAAAHSHVLAYDNLSSTPGWLSDGFCRVSTGGGYPSRQLRTDDEEWFICARRPIILNGITAAPTRGDLADRAITVRLRHIPPDQRRTYAAQDEEVAKDSPHILVVSQRWNRKGKGGEVWFGHRGC